MEILWIDKGNQLLETWLPKSSNPIWTLNTKNVCLKNFEKIYYQHSCQSAKYNHLTNIRNILQSPLKTGSLTNFLDNYHWNTSDEIELWKFMLLYHVILSRKKLPLPSLGRNSKKFYQAQWLNLKIACISIWFKEWETRNNNIRWHFREFIFRLHHTKRGIWITVQSPHFVARWGVDRNDNRNFWSSCLRFLSSIFAEWNNFREVSWHSYDHNGILGINS